VAGALAAILDSYTVIDVSVHDPPLDQVIAQVFEQGQAQVDGQPEAEVSHVGR
jgi:ABC-2 type transport system ATP-binding protein